MLSEQIAELLGIHPQSGTEWTIECPNPDHHDRRPSASIYVGEPQERLKGGKINWRLPGMWVCYSCGARGRIANDRIVTYEPPATRNLQVAEELLAPHARREYPESWLDLFEYYDGVHPYWLSRFPELVCRRHRLGYDFDTECGTYPLRSTEGRVLGVVRRDLTGTRPWKYHYPPGVDVGELLFGYAEGIRNDVDTVVLGEGALDAIALDEALTQMGRGDRVAAMAIYGSHLREAQAKLLRRLHPARIITAFDNDEAGQDAYESVREELFDYDVAPVSFVAKDVADLSVTDRVDALNSVFSA